MALQFGYFPALSLRSTSVFPMIITLALALENRNKAIPAIDPKQIIFGVLSACALMLAILLMCIFVAYIAMAAMQAF